MRRRNHAQACTTINPNMTNCSYCLIGPSPNRLFHHMRSSKPRPRSKNNRNNNNNNRSVANVMNRVFDSSGPEGKVRGTPQQIIEKYQQLTRDSQLSGDRVAAENFQQHAEHYMRLQAEAQREIDARREQQDRENREKQVQRDQERNDRSEQQTERVEHNTPPTPSAFDVTDFTDAPQPDFAPLSPIELSQSAPVATQQPEERPKPRVRRRSEKPAATASATPEPARED
jgi:hypothetical protein